MEMVIGRGGATLWPGGWPPKKKKKKKILIFTLIFLKNL
jgi:hypothetical protein